MLHASAAHAANEVPLTPAGEGGVGVGVGSQLSKTASHILSGMQRTKKLRCKSPRQQLRQHIVVLSPGPYAAAARTPATAAAIPVRERGCGLRRAAEDATPAAHQPVFPGKLGRRSSQFLVRRAEEVGGGGGHETFHAPLNAVSLRAVRQRLKAGGCLDCYPFNSC